jgi:hypothetical protein
VTFERRNLEAGKTVVLETARGVLQDDRPRSRCREDLEAAGIRGVHQAALSLDEQNLGPVGLPG